MDSDSTASYYIAEMLWKLSSLNSEFTSQGKYCSKNAKFYNKGTFITLFKSSRFIKVLTLASPMYVHFWSFLLFLCDYLLKHSANAGSHIGTPLLHAKYALKILNGLAQTSKYVRLCNTSFCTFDLVWKQTPLFPAGFCSFHLHRQCPALPAFSFSG